MSSGVHVTRDQPIGRGPFNSISPTSAVSSSAVFRRYLFDLSGLVVVILSLSKGYSCHLFERSFRVSFGFLSGVIFVIASVS